MEPKLLCKTGNEQNTILATQSQTISITSYCLSNATSTLSQSFLLLKIPFANNVVLPILKINIIKFFLTSSLVATNSRKRPSPSSSLSLIPPAALLFFFFFVRYVVDSAFQPTTQIQRKVPCQIIQMHSVVTIPLRKFAPYNLQWFDMMDELLPRSIGTDTLKHACFI